MKRNVIAFAALAALAWPLLSGVSAQSLAEVARREEARRKAITNPSRVYTNDDLKRYEPLAPITGGESTPAPAQPPSQPGTVPGQSARIPEAAAAEKRAAEAAAKEREPVKDEAYWRARISDIRTKIARTKAYIDALQTRANSLYNDFIARDDPAQKLQLEAERQKTLAEMERLKRDMVDLVKAAADIEEEARRAGVPPGWLR